MKRAVREKVLPQEFELLFKDIQDDAPDAAMTPAEFAHLKRGHGPDPFPACSTFLEEQESWLPRDAAALGYEFLAARMPHAPPEVIRDFLRRLNKVFLRREKRKVKRVKEAMGKTISELRRKLNNAKPYRGVMAERQNRRLKNMLHDSREKFLTGKPKKYNPEDDQADDAYDVHQAPTAELLQISLSSLENIGRHLHQTVDQSVQHGGRNHPSEPYLRGSLWLGRNMSMIAEELSEVCMQQL